MDRNKANVIRKESIKDLAIFGGTPAFPERLHVGRPNVPNRHRFISRINDILDTRWLTNRGVYVREFEKRLADLIGVKHCISMCNGTIALEIAARAAGIKGEIIVPSFTFIATVHAMQWQEIVPVFCDIDPKTGNIDPACVEKLITPRTSGIVGVHLWGRPCDIDGLNRIAQKYNLKLLFDAAHAFGCSYKGKMIGNFGDAEIYSFHATKIINTLEGGAVVTNNDALAEKVRLMQNFGFSGHDNVIYIGTNGKMNEISGAAGITALESLDDFISVNRRNYKHYREELAGIPGINVLMYDESEKCNYQYIIVDFDASVTKITRDLILQILHSENVLARRYFYPGAHRMEPYRSYFPNAGLLLPVTNMVVDRILSLPTGTAVDRPTISNICQIICFVVAHGKKITERLSGNKENKI